MNEERKTAEIVSHSLSFQGVMGKVPTITYRKGPIGQPVRVARLTFEVEVPAPRDLLRVGDVAALAVGEISMELEIRAVTRVMLHAPLGAPADAADEPTEEDVKPVDVVVDGEVVKVNADTGEVLSEGRKRRPVKAEQS